MELARQLGDADSFLWAATLLINVEWAPQHQRERLELAREVADKYALPAGEATGGGPIGIPGIGHLGLGRAFLDMGERARAEELWGRLKERAELTQDPDLLMYVLSTDGAVPDSPPR